LGKRVIREEADEFGSITFRREVTLKAGDGLLIKL
jgi:hypothetical protein